MLEIKGIYHDVNPTWSIGKNRGHDTIACVTQGKVMYWVGSEQMELNKGEVLYIPPEMDRSWSNHPAEPHNKYTVIFTAPLLSYSILPFVQSGVRQRIKIQNVAYYEQRFANMFVQWVGKRRYYEQVTSHALSELLALMGQDIAERTSTPSKEWTARRIQEYILQNFRRNITLEELSSLTGITPNYVTVVFKEVIGCTPIQYLHQTRISTAVNLLDNGQMTVAEVAEYLGYCDQAYFNRMFKKWMGVSPTQIKQ